MLQFQALANINLKDPFEIFYNKFLGKKAKRVKLIAFFPKKNEKSKKWRESIVPEFC